MCFEILIPLVFTAIGTAVGADQSSQAAGDVRNEMERQGQMAREGAAGLLGGEQPLSAVGTFGKQLLSPLASTEATQSGDSLSFLPGYFKNKTNISSWL